MESLEDENYRHSMVYYKDVQEQFRQASNSMQMDIEHWYRRLAENNDISYASAKKFLKSSELEEFKWSVEQYIKAGQENAVDHRWMKELENASARHHINYLTAMKMQVQQHAELLSVEFEKGMTDFLHKSYAENYYKSAFEVARGTGVGSNLAQLDTRRINTLIRKPWAQDGADFSDRIWSNKQKLVSNLHKELTQGIIRGALPREAIDRLAKTMDVSKAQAGRLVMTESAAIAAAAQKDALKELGVEQYEILATLDNRTSEICRELDGKVFDLKDYEVGVTAPPFHPCCRTTTVPYFDDEFTEGEQRAARDETTGKIYYVPADIKYNEWKRQFVAIGSEPKRYTNIVHGGIIEPETARRYDYVDEKYYETLIERHRANVSESERSCINGFDWDNFREGNARYGYINTENSFKINEAIRRGTVHDLPRQSQETIESLINVISNNVIDEDILIRRYVDDAWLMDKMPYSTGDRLADIQKLIESGNVIMDKQFVSCSLNSNVSYTDRQIEIVFKVPKGTNAYVTENRMESEMIMYKPEYKIEKAETITDQDGAEKIIVTCEIVRR